VSRRSDRPPWLCVQRLKLQLLWAAGHRGCNSIHAPSVSATDFSPCFRERRRLNACSCGHSIGTTQTPPHTAPTRLGWTGYPTTHLLYHAWLASQPKIILVSIKITSPMRTAGSFHPHPDRPQLAPAIPDLLIRYHAISGLGLPARSFFLRCRDEARMSAELCSRQHLQPASATVPPVSSAKRCPSRRASAIEAVVDRVNSDGKQEQGFHLQMAVWLNLIDQMRVHQREAAGDRARSGFAGTMQLPKVCWPLRRSNQLWCQHQSRLLQGLSSKQQRWDRK